MGRYLRILESMIDRLGQDLRYAWRMARRAPAVTAVAVLSLALGVGANTAIFSLVDKVLLQSLPVRAPGELVEFLSTFPGDPRMNSFQWNFYDHVRDTGRTFSDVAATSPGRFRLGVEARDADTIDGEYVSGNLFTFLGLRAAAGRLILPEDDRPNAPDAAAVVISWRFWQSRFNLDPSIVGSR